MLTQLYSFALLLLICFKTVITIWPPSYKIELKQEEEFVISEMIQPSEIQDIYDEEELLQSNDLKKLNINMDKNDSERYFNIHRHANMVNERVRKDVGIINNNQTEDSVGKVNETNFDVEEAIPHEAGFIDKDDKFINGTQIILDSNEVVVDTDHEEKQDQNYDYNNFKNEFENEVKAAEQKANETATYKNVKEDESPGEALETLVEVTGNEKNCTKDDLNGIGINAAKCIWKEMTKPRLQKDKINTVEKMLRIFIIWIIIYIFIAIPLWCQYGWCCCCCRFTWCQPMDIIDEAKGFYANNPPGVFIDLEKGETFKYKSTNYEKYAQRNLGAAISRL